MKRRKKTKENYPCIDSSAFSFFSAAALVDLLLLEIKTKKIESRSVAILSLKHVAEFYQFLSRFFSLFRSVLLFLRTFIKTQKDRSVRIFVEFFFCVLFEDATRHNERLCRNGRMGRSVH